MIPKYPYHADYNGRWGSSTTANAVIPPTVALDPAELANVADYVERVHNLEVMVGWLLTRLEALEAARESGK